MENQVSTIVCPNCGAAMITKGFSYICDFCGYIDGCGEIGSIPLCNKEEVNSRFEYLEYNKNYLTKKSGFVSIFDKYVIKSRKMFHPRVDYSVISNVSISLLYKNDNECEELRLYIHSPVSENNPYIAFMTSASQKLYLHFSSRDDNGYYAIMDIISLFKLSKSLNLLYATNCFSLEYDFSEFPIYCARFYNVTFSRNQFIYSFNKHLIID